MKKFILSVLCVAVFFVGLGSLVEKAGARFKSDEKALDLVAKARLAIGGDAAINEIQSLRIVGQTTKVFNFDGKSRSETGETEIAMMMPDQLMKMTKLGHDDGTGAAAGLMKRRIDVDVTTDGGTATRVIRDGDPAVGANGNTVHKIIVKKPDGTTEELNGADVEKFRVQKDAPDTVFFKVEDKDAANDGENHVILHRTGGAGGFAAHHDGMRQNEMLRLTLGLLMSSPKGSDVEYQLGGDGNVDGTSCNIIVANSGGSSFKIYLNKNTNLPMMLSYTAPRMPAIIKLRGPLQTGDPSANGEKVILDHGTGVKPETAEFSVRFDDYRSIGGVQLPYKWTQTVGGNADETFEVSAYEVNPANIADKFKSPTVMFRTKKPADQ